MEEEVLVAGGTRGLLLGGGGKIILPLGLYIYLLLRPNLEIGLIMANELRYTLAIGTFALEVIIL
jgi:hypothetical protein